MKRLYKLIYTLLIGFVVLTGNGVYDMMLRGIIAVIGFTYSFRFIGGISGSLNYNSEIMSFAHWTVRTIVVVALIYTTRYVYLFLLTIIVNEILCVVICAISLIVIAETLKSITKLKKNYW